MPQQSLHNHSRFVTLYHFILLPLILLFIVGSIVNLFCSNQPGEALLTEWLLVLLGIIAFLITFFTRSFALKAQDRAIRAEENLRHFALTGKLLPSSIRLSQIIALRFASDEEFVQLAERAATKQLRSKDIKQAIVNWRTDDNRL
jgi:L-cystine uptake protein TcyP (sodium:dicarboxylate symporter family)